jgi:hypothetical protein
MGTIDMEAGGTSVCMLFLKHGLAWVRSLVDSIFRPVPLVQHVRFPYCVTDHDDAAAAILQWLGFV